MKVKYLIASVFSLSLLLVGPAAGKTGRSGDMFNEGRWNITDRPSVPSDETRGSDMFPAVPLAVEPNADVFGRAQPNYDPGQEEMVIVRPTPMPHYPLFQRKNDRD